MCTASGHNDVAGDAMHWIPMIPAPQAVEAHDSHSRTPRCPACDSRHYHRDGDWDNETGEQVAAYMLCRTCGHSGPIE